MTTHPLSFSGTVWEFFSEKVSGGWFLVSLPPDVGEEIAFLTAENRRPFGSVKVQLTLGGSTWKSSLFRDSKIDSYVMLLRKDVREAEGIGAGDTVTVTVKLLG
jgi:hypothetical protein